MKLFVHFVLALLLALGLISCGEMAPKKIRIAVATFSHETCTFCPSPTGIEEWEYYGPPVRGDEVLKSDSYIQGFVDRASEYGGVELIGIYSPRDAKGGSSGSWVTKEAFDKYTNGMVEDLKKIQHVDGVYLALHGAMAVDGIMKPEAEIARRIRAVVGDAPIVITYDLHANEDEEIAEAANAVFITKQYPHYDARYQGERAARILIKTIRGTYKPVMAVRKPGVLTPSVFQWTGESPAMEIMERARRWEESTKDVFVSVAFGFAYADVPDVGATVMVVTNDNKKLADEIAQEMSDYIWRVREKFAGKKIPKVKDGVAQAIKAAREGHKPVVIADHSDRTGNSSWVLEELLKQGTSNFCITTIADSVAIKQLVASAKVGEPVDVTVGGCMDEYAGNPVRLKGTLTFLGKYGQFPNVAVVQLPRNNHVIITPLLHQVITTNIFKPVGVDLSTIDIIVLKSRVHFRRGYDDNGFAKTIILVDAPGLGPADLSGIPYKNIPKDIYPLTRK
ncbi:MAG: M81 family metallopeptidase [Ignavibacteria bacterium]|nr:M81 family metallopeptidase [Ignavibacteria bacterium]